MRKIYVTGLGVISGIGKGVEENLDSLKAGKHGMGKITLFPTALDVPVSEVKQSNEELKKLLSLPSGKTYSRTALLGLWAAQEAARDAELDFTSPRIGLISSTSIGGMDASERFYASFREDNRKGRLRDIISHDCGSSTEMIAAYLGVKGTVTTLSTACSSAANAIMLGARLIRHGLLDAVAFVDVVGIVEDRIHRLVSVEVDNPQDLALFHRMHPAGTGLDGLHIDGFRFIAFAFQILCNHVLTSCVVKFSCKESPFVFRAPHETRILLGAGFAAVDGRFDGLARILRRGAERMHARVENHKRVDLRPKIHIIAGFGVVLKEGHGAFLVHDDLGKEVDDFREVPFGHSVFPEFDQKGVVAVAVEVVVGLLILFFPEFLLDQGGVRAAAEHVVPSAGVLGDAHEDAAHVGIDAAVLRQTADMLDFQGVAEIEALGKVVRIVKHRRDVSAPFQIGQTERLAASDDSGIVPAAGNDVLGDDSVRDVVVHDMPPSYIP